jgi:hypothetical protein
MSQDLENGVVRGSQLARVLALQLPLGLNGLLKLEALLLQGLNRWHGGVGRQHRHQLCKALGWLDGANKEYHCNALSCVGIFLRSSTTYLRWHVFSKIGSSAEDTTAHLHALLSSGGLLL